MHNPKLPNLCMVLLPTVYAKGQSKYILIFSFISFMYNIHFTVCTPFLFFWIFLYFCCYSIHLKSLSIWHGTYHLLLFRHQLSHVLCWIRLYNILTCPFRHWFSHTLSRVETSAAYDLIGRSRVYAWWNMQYLLSAWLSLRKWASRIYCYLSN